MKYQVFLYGDAAPMHLFETLADARRFAKGAVAEGALYAEVYNKKDKRLNHYRLAPQRPWQVNRGSIPRRRSASPARLTRKQHELRKI